MAERILLVDDEEGIRRVLGISLEDSGYDVLTAGNGEEALEIFREKRPPIVLTDIKMPGMDGIELLRKIKEESPDTEVIMISGHGDMELAIKSLQYEAADFVTKPIMDEALEIALKRARERILMRRQLREYTENLENIVQEKTRKLLEAERLAAIGQTVAALSHAIKNIVGGLKGGIFVLDKGIKLENREYLMNGWEMVRRNVDKISNLAMDMLSYARDREPDYQLCDPNKCLRDVFNLMCSRADEHGVELRMEVDEGLQQCLLDPDAIHCCLVNLVTNAIDACADVGNMKTKREVIVRSLKCDDCAVAFEVEDTGCGMDEETCRNVFHSFFSTKGTKGTGMGLMITKKIVDEHAGTIEVASEKSRGTRFMIKLPGGKGAGCRVQGAGGREE